ncbi:hypothetical protein LCGC14_0686670 [marine sediment metagenome]|uniref:Uncharacterized protein n=1 Tax=marine sediment metagenome TaxID=412755 RepID=A0A0F9QLM2_9ZZZZ
MTTQFIARPRGRPRKERQTSDCQHHWNIETSASRPGECQGNCQLCGDTRFFLTGTGLALLADRHDISVIQ